MAKQVRVWTGTQWDTLAVQLPSADNPVFTGTTSSPMFSATQSVGDEGGEIKFAKAATNTTLNTGVTLDVYQDRVRLFETGGTNRGGYIDMSTLSTGVGTNLAPGLTYITQATVTNASSLNINNCFTSTYNNYLLVMDLISTSGPNGLSMQLLLNGTPSTASYSFNYIYASNNAGPARSWNSSQTYSNIGSIGNASGHISLLLTNPALAKPTMGNGHYVFNDSTVFENGSVGMVHNISTAYDGIKIYPGASNITGTVRVYGYRNS